MKRAKIFCGDCINLPLSLYRLLLSSKPETISAMITPDERVIVETFLSFKNGEIIDFNLMTETLFAWQKWIAENS